MTDLRRKADIIFYQIVTISVFFVAAIFFVTLLLKNRVASALSVWGSEIAAICGCTDHFAFSSHPYLFSFLILAVALIVAFLFYTIVNIIVLRIRTNRFIAVNLENKKPHISNKLNKVILSLNLQNKIIESKNENLSVFCYGFINSKICISSGLVKKLKPDELKAVLLHEKHHLIHFETTKIFIVKVITRALFFLPGLKTLAGQYYKLSEVSADDWAIKNTSSKLYLARAMYKVLKLNESTNFLNSLAVVSFGDVIEERINKITDDSYVIKINLVKTKFFLHTILVSTFLLLFTFFIYNSEAAIHDHSEAVCASNHSDGHLACQMTNNGSVCNMQNMETNVSEKHVDSCGYEQGKRNLFQTSKGF